MPYVLTLRSWLDSFVGTYLYPIPPRIFWIVAPIASLVLLRIILQRLPRRKTTRAWFDDLSAPKESRSDKNRVLTESILTMLHNPVPVPQAELHMDMMPGTDEPGFGGLEHAIDITPVGSYEYSDRPMKIASVEFSARDVVAFISHVFRRPEGAYLEGWLHETAHGVVAFAQLSHHRRARDTRKWRVERFGPGAREQALADLAAKILTETGRSTLTRSWQSLRSFREALTLRQDAETRPPDTSLKKAIAHLEDAVAFDASNWIARFNLALSLVRDDQVPVALKHLEMLEFVVKHAWPSKDGRWWLRFVRRAPNGCPGDRQAFQNVVRHLTTYPECAFLILYNKALATATGTHNSDVCLEMLGKIGCLRERAGAAAFEKPYDDIAGHLTRQSRVELSLYALSAQASLLASPFHITAEQHVTPALRSASGRIKDLFNRIDSLCDEEKEEHWRSLQTARAVALTACARVLAATGDTDRAHDALQTAIVAEPRFVEAQLLLAEIYITSKARCASDWLRRAVSLLRHVLDLSPQCAKAKRLLMCIDDDAGIARSTDSGVLQDVESLLRRPPHDRDVSLHLARKTLMRCDRGADVSEPFEWLCRHIKLARGFNTEAARLFDALLSNTAVTSVAGHLGCRDLMALLHQLQTDPIAPDAERIAEAVALLRTLGVSAPDSRGSLPAL